MDYSTVLTHASKLKKNSLYKVTIADATKEILIELNKYITDSHEAGLSRIEYKLPINFRRIDESITNTELQTAIYYNVVSELEKKDYEVKLKFMKTHTLIKVSWVVKTANTELEKMKHKLLSLGDH